MGVFCYTSMPLQPFTPVTKLLPVNSCINPRLFSVHFFPPLTLRLLLTGFALKQHSPHAPELLISPLFRVLPPLTPPLKFRTAEGGFQLLKNFPLSPSPPFPGSPLPFSLLSPPLPRRFLSGPVGGGLRRPGTSPGALPQPPELGSLSPAPSALVPLSPSSRSPPRRPAHRRGSRPGTGHCGTAHRAAGSAPSRRAPSGPAGSVAAGLSPYGAFRPRHGSARPGTAPGSPPACARCERRCCMEREGRRGAEGRDGKAAGGDAGAGLRERCGGGGTGLRGSSEGWAGAG